MFILEWHQSQTPDNVCVEGWDLVKTCLIATIKRGKEAGSDSVENDDPIGVMTRDHRDKWARDTCHT